MPSAARLGSRSGFHPVSRGSDNPRKITRAFEMFVTVAAAVGGLVERFEFTKVDQPVECK